MTATTAISTTPVEDRDEWQTPPLIYHFLDVRYGPFTLDVAATNRNRQCSNWLGPGSPIGEDALATRWRFVGAVGGRPVKAFCNPPYSRGMVEKFMRKAWEEAQIGNARTTLLVPATTEMPWFHDLVWDREDNRFRPGVEAYFFRGRIRFLRPNGLPAGSPTFASMAVTLPPTTASAWACR